MSKSKKSTVDVQGTTVSIVCTGNDDYISLTDMLKAKDGEFFISDWLRNRNTVEFLGIWESVFNPAFNYGEFAIIKSKAGLNRYKISSNDSHPDIFSKLEMWFGPEFNPVEFNGIRTGREGQT